MIGSSARAHGRILRRWLGVTLLAGVAGGCVSLTQPTEVASCASTGSCVNGARADAKKDLQPSFADGGGPEVAPDAASDGDLRESDVADAGLGEVLGDAREVGSSDGKAGPESGPEAVAGPEPIGAEPSVGPEPGPEPAREPGLEPGPEPGPEPTPEPARDGGGPDGAAPACANATPVTGGGVTLETTSAFCFVTCDSMEYGWGCDSFGSVPDAGADFRSVTVNGVAVSCGGTLPAKTSGGYYYFQIGAGGHVWDHIHYSGTAATSCPKPAGGFAP